MRLRIRAPQVLTAVGLLAFAAVAAAAALAALAACGDPAAPPPSGLLRVSIGTLGDDPDPDGYLLRVDEADAVPVDLNGITDFDLVPGRHQLTLDGLASHCSIESAASRVVEIAPDDMTIVTFEISCPLTGARVSVSTTGLDLDTTGYAVEVDDVARDSLGTAGVFLLRLEPGDHTIALTGLAPNCTAEEPSRSVTIVPKNAATIEFAVVCTAATGVIRLVVTGVGMDQEGSFRAIVDGRSRYISYLIPNDIRVLPGAHTVSVDPPDDCATNTPPQTVTVTAGELVRDTVGVSFAVTCVSPVGSGGLAFTATEHDLARESPPPVLGHTLRFAHEALSRARSFVEALEAGITAHRRVGLGPQQDGGKPSLLQGTLDQAECLVHVSENRIGRGDPLYRVARRQEASALGP